MSGYINCQTIFAEKSKMLITSENSANSILEQLESAGFLLNHNAVQVFVVHAGSRKKSGKVTYNCFPWLT